MNKAENKSEHGLNNKKKEEIKLLPHNITIDKEKVLLSNEYLSSIFKNPPIIEKKYQNEELNKFKDDILNYLYERNQHFMALINLFQDKILESKKEYMSQINIISQNYNSILSSQASLNNKIDKISNFELFINKTNDQLITHEIRINNLSSDFIKSTQKYDKIYLDNLELPGYIGKFAKFKNCQAFFENVIREIDKINQYKEKNNMDLKSYKEKLDSIIKSFHLLIKNNNDAQMKYIKQLNEKCFRECKDMNELLGNRVSDLRIENAKYSIELVKKNEEMNKEWKKILEIKDNLLNIVNEKINNIKTIFNANNNSFITIKNEFEEFKSKINEIIFFYKELKNDNSNINSNINLNLNNNSCNNYNGCFISNALPLEKKNFKNLPRKFSKRAKTKNKYLEKKQFIKNISNLNSNKYNDINKASNIFNEYKNNIIKIEKLEEANSNHCNNINTIINKEKEKENRKRNFGNSLNKEKTITSIERYKYNSDYLSKRNSNGFKEPRSCKNVTKIEIDSQNKININGKKEDKDKSIIENRNEEKNDKDNDNNDSNKNIKNSSSSSTKNREKEKEKIVIHKYSKKNKKSFLQSNKSSQSEDFENNNISNININSGNSNTLNTTNDINYSVYSTNSICNVNKFILNDNILDGNDKVIKELASELEQSTNKKDKLASNAKKIEDNFKVICNKISPLNLNKNNEEISIKTIINENDENSNINNNNAGLSENIKLNTVSTEKTEETPKVNVINTFSNINNACNANNTNNVSGSNNNKCVININQNEYNSLNKKMDLFDKKLYDLESLLKEKIVEILLQIDNLQNVCYYSLKQKKAINQKMNNANFSMNANLNSNINITNPNEISNNIKTVSSRDDYFIHSHSVKRIAPIIEIDPNNLQFSPSPNRNQNVVMSNKKSRDKNVNKSNKFGYSNNYKDIKIFKKNENKENIRNDNFDLTQFRILGKNTSILGVNKWINLNKLIKYEQNRTANFSANNGGLLANGIVDNN